MSWQLGMNEVTEEIQAYKNKISSKETQIAAQQNEIMKHASEIADLKATLNETLHKLNHETSRAISLESNLAKCTEDLRNESLAAQNASAALVGVQEKLKNKDLEVRAMEDNLQSMSHKSAGYDARGAQLSKEKGVLEARVRELEVSLRHLSTPASTATTPSRQRAAARRRSSSVSDAHNAVLVEQELKVARESLAQKDVELRSTATKLAQLQSELVKAENEKTASEKRLLTQLRDLQSSLQEKSEELDYLREQDGGSREEELLKRIDEDDARIAALEKLLAESTETKKMKSQIRQMEQQLLAENQRITEAEGRNVDIVREREEALDELQGSRTKIRKLEEALQLKDAAIHRLESQRLNSPSPSVEQDIERMLGAIDRIRSERDNLRRDVEFLQAEARFTEKALQGRVAALTTRDSEQSAELCELREERAVSCRRIAENNARIQKLERATMVSAIMMRDLQDTMAVVQTPAALDSAQVATLPQPDDALENALIRLKEVELQLGSAALGLDAMTRQRDKLMAQLSSAESLQDDANARAGRMEKEISDLASDLDEVSAERDSLNLQVTNLTRDLELAQEELAEGEKRYSELQFHQLSAMTTNAASAAMRAQLEEQELRILRRTEMVGILQHDQQRLETNLKLQEERLAEMVGELEIMAAEKAAMVEDCAEARQARDVAVARVEEMDVEIEALESRAVESEAALCSLIGVSVEMRSSSKAQTVDSASEHWEARIAELKSSHRELISTLQVNHAEEIRTLRKEKTDGADLEDELAQLKVKHVEELGLLQGRLVETASVLDEARARFAAAEEDLRRANADLAQSESAARDSTALVNELRAESARSRADDAQIIKTLNDKIAVAEVSTEKLRMLHEESIAALNAANGNKDARLSELEAHIKELDSQIQSRTTQFDRLSAETESLRERIDEESKSRRQEKLELDELICSERDRAASSLTALQEELSSLSSELAHARLHIGTLEGEKVCLHAEITELQAEIQRSLSLRRHLEGQLLDREKVASTLKTELEDAKSRQIKAEQAEQTAEVNLSLQSAQHRREMSEIQRNLAILQAQPDTTPVIAELEERNTEMEELLRQKCSEIEEYDDRAIELLKSNKKLATKVETLNRKVQNLQAKLAAAKVTAPTPVVSSEIRMEEPVPIPVPTSFPEISAPRQRSTTLSAAPIPPVFVQPSPGPSASKRIASGSALPRPKTPERRATPLVFKAQTPERRAVLAEPPSPAAPVLGQKRRAPDDFEDVRVPTQGFTADSLPDENSTPRVRRMLNSIHSGFTPVRNSASRAVAAIPSPNKRAMPASRSVSIADVTNSPRLGDRSKRTWLGKIRGSSQPRAASSRTPDS